MKIVHIAIDRETGLALSDEDAEKAADNPGIWTWVDFVPAMQVVGV